MHFELNSVAVHFYMHVHACLHSGDFLSQSSKRAVTHALVVFSCIADMHIKYDLIHL